MNQKRQLIALMFSDLVDYGTKTTENEASAMEMLTEYRAVFRRLLPLYGGRENKTIGDAFFVEFGSALEAVLCAIEIQTTLYEHNLIVPKDRRSKCRIGIHLGDVIQSEGDSFGEGVNIAARIERFADKGGICISRQVADQLASFRQIRLKSLGRKHLKHVHTPTELFKVRLPWERARTRWRLRPWLGRLATDRARRSLVDLLRAQVLASFFIAILAIFSFLCFRAWQGFQSYAWTPSRRPAAQAAARRLPLDGQWKFSIAPYDSRVEPGQGASGIVWRDLDPPYEKYGDVLSRPYWLRRKFSVSDQFRAPTIVLGPIPGAHRTYLNGRLIGGSNLTFTLAYYTFDARLLHRDQSNVLIVKVDPKPSLTPAIVRLPSVGSFLGEFDDVYATVISNEYYYHVVQTVYLAVALLCFLACLIFYLFDLDDKKYLYFAIYLLLGSMSLLHSNDLVCAFLDFRLQRAFRLFGLSLSAVALLSMYFHLIQRRKAELVNNLIGLGWSGWLASTLLQGQPSSVAYLEKWNFILVCTIAYSLIWVITLFNYRLVRLFRESNRWPIELEKLGYEAVFLFFGLLTPMLAFGSLKLSAVRALPLVWRSDAFRLGTTYPFLFAACILGIGLFDYIVKNRSVRYRRHAEDLLLSIAEIVRRNARPQEVIPLIQKKVGEFIQIERSTIYLWEETEGGPMLKAQSILGSAEAKSLVRPFLKPDQGIIGYVCRTKAPLLIRDIATDVRFQERLTERGHAEPHAYRTHSCMLFPLIVEERVVGVLTVADKRQNLAFNRHDFSVLHVVAKDLAMLIHLQNLAHRGLPSVA